MIIFISGKSGSGKDTVARYILSKYNITNRVLYTTRPMRKGEVDGDEYSFVSEQTFSDMIKQGKFLEYRYYYTAYGKWYYGTPKENLDENILLWGSHSMYVAIYDNLEKLGKLDSLKSIYLDTAGWVRLDRMLMRNKDEKDRDEREHYISEVLRRYLADEVDFDGVQSQYSKVIDTTNNFNADELNLFVRECGISLKS